MYLASLLFLCCLPSMPLMLISNFTSSWHNGPLVLYTNGCQFSNCSLELLSVSGRVNTLRLKQNVVLFADNTFKCISWMKIVVLGISLTFILKDKSALVHIMAWCRTAIKPSFEPMMALCARNTLVTDESPHKGPVMWTFDDFLMLPWTSF